MTQVADDAALGKISRQWNDVFRRVREGSKTPEEVSKVLVRFTSEGQEDIPRLSRPWKILWCDGLDTKELAKRVDELYMFSNIYEDVRSLPPLRGKFFLFHATPKSFGVEEKITRSKFVSILKEYNFDLCPPALGLYLRLADQDQTIVSESGNRRAYWMAQETFRSPIKNANCIFGLQWHDRYNAPKLDVDEDTGFFYPNTRYVFQGKND